MSRVPRAVCAVLWTLFVAAFTITNAQDFRYGGPILNNTATWCTVSKAEQNKCLAFSRAVDREISRFQPYYVSLKCKQAFNKEECMAMLDHELAQLTTLDPGEVFTAGRYHSLLPIMLEAHGNNSAISQTYQYAVAVVKKGTLTDVNTLYDLRGKKACFAGVGTLAGWITPLETLMRQGGLEVIDCNNHVKSTIKYFGPSCAVNSLVDRYNPLGDNSDQLCKLCIGEIPGGRCTNADPYAGYEGAFRCLLEVGEIAFLVNTTVIEMTSTNYDLNSVTKDQFELLCLNGSRARVDDAETCNWGRVPTRAIVASSATGPELRQLYQRFLQRAVNLFGPNNYAENSTDRYPGRQDNFENRPTFDERDPNGGGNRYEWSGDGRSRGNDFNNPYGVNTGSGFNNQYNEDGGNSYNNPYNQNGEESYNDKYGKSDSESRYGQGYIDRRGENDPENRYGQGYNGETTRDPNYTGSDYRPLDNANREGNPIYNVTPIERFSLFESAPRYGLQHNLLFSDTARGFVSMRETDQTYVKYLGRSLNSIMSVRRCTVNSMTLCVTSEPEMEKCVKMRIALKAQLLKPQLDCYKGYSQINCMQAIENGNADITVLDASDVYTAGLRFQHVPFISEVYNLGSPEYYVVAVAKESDEKTDLTYLKNKYTCHTGMNMAAGWVYPLAYLISNGWIRGYGCDSVRAAAEYFTKSCVPGALSTEYNTGVPYDNMCDLCHGESSRYCRRDATEVYFGYTGAFRCLVEGGGDVAFVKHTTVSENTNGKRREFWARNTFMKDFELLCPDGTRRPSNDYENCNLGKVKANAIITRGGYYGYNETQINAYINLFIYAQQFYGRKDEDEFSFSMFSSPPPYSDLIFQDATQQLVVIPPEKREFSAYLGGDFMRARRIVDCNAGANAIEYSLLATIGTIVVTFILSR